jgi:hemolysin III
MRDDLHPAEPGTALDLGGAGARPTPAAPAPRRRPRLRGVSHQIAAFAAVPAAGWLVFRARSASAIWGALVYGITLVLLFSVSAAYHRVYWPLSVRRVIGRIDHSAIFLLIAGTYTPFCLLLGPGTGYRLLAAVWIGAGAGIATVVWLTGTPKPIRASLYVLLGWFILPAIPAVRAGVGDGALALLLGGGALYTAGAAIYAARRPDPFPDVFGFHEIFHLLVVAAAACHFLVVEAAVRALR